MTEITNQYDNITGTFSFADLYKELPVLTVSHSVRLIAIDAEGGEHRANVGYSSDLHAFALTQYDKDDNIVSLMPLPTRNTHAHKGSGISETITNSWSDGKPPELSTRFKILEK